MCVRSFSASRRLAGRFSIGAAARWLNLAGALLIVSLTCRAVDQALCPVWPLGTHLGWHLVNAAMLYCCMRGLLAVPAARTDAGGLRQTSRPPLPKR